ncbi:multidrug resistance-associated protein 1 [Aspergillus udagawae]|uniref:Multidrug resistance-associated protein 1 n=1 Tax=Aspergillus udagawae TaxID=91492 RepID=A0ABQ1BCK3_9EURO|nr:multidrug resistance-associated protein 1 [Aspergillus udagawae]GFG17247.1 multidrug resistance-associated protein 1 [Aspergillus udagawae]
MVKSQDVPGDYSRPRRYRWFNPLQWGRIPPIPDARTVTKEYEAGFWSQLVFHWMGEHMSTGYHRSLEYNDIWLVHPKRATETLASRLMESLSLRVSQNESNPLHWAIYDTFRRDIWSSGLLRLVSDLFLVFAPFTLRYLISFVQSSYPELASGGSSSNVGIGIGLLVGIMVMQVLQSLTNSHYQYRAMLMGAQARSALVSLIFAKALKLSNRAKAGFQDTNSSEKDGVEGSTRVADGGWPDGRIISLMSNDTERIFQASKVIHLVWTSPIAIILTMVLLLINLTSSALPGIAVLVLGLAGVTRAVRTLNNRRDNINSVSDERMNLTQEILQGIRFVKYFAWEQAFDKRLREIRAREIHSLQVLLVIRSALGAVSMAIPIFSNMLAYITYSLTGHSLDAAIIFSSLALFNCLRNPLNWLPIAIGQSADAWSSMRRIEKFLLAEEFQDQVLLDEQMHAAIEMRDASFTWERTTESQNEVPFKLEHVTFQAEREELIAVVGAVGSGKTSLLSALASEMRNTAGVVRQGASRAYCPQHAWIQNASVRDNILFGKEFDPDWYHRVVDACALYPDFRELPAGDSTEIGERGINLSGGQKQRINLARAIYSRSDIVLLDDPMSAVDAHVGEHIFQHALCGLLQGRCRILATHHLHLLSRCDRIVWLHEGRILAQGTYEYLVRKNAHFGAFIERYSRDQSNDHQRGIGEQDQNEGAFQNAQLSSSQTYEGGALMTTETKAVKSVPWGVYVAYVRASGSLFNAAWLIVLLLAFRAANIMTSLWLSYWSEDAYHLNRGQYVGVYACLGLLQGLLLFTFSVLTSIFGTTASKHMSTVAMWRILRSPLSFFDTTPLGRITRRFTHDINLMDNNLTDPLRMYLVVLSMIIGVFVLTIAYFYYFAVAIAPLAIMLLAWTAYYRASARELKRHESLLGSIMYARFTEALVGVPSIRAYGLQRQFEKTLVNAIDNMNSALFLTFANERWLSVRLDGIGNTLVLVTGILVIIERDRIAPSISGLILSYSLSIVQLIQFTVRQFADVEAAMNATERVQEYSDLPTEAPLRLGRVPDSWPMELSISFENVSMVYRPGLPPALKSFTLSVAGGEKIGIVGRTGAGKSSIMVALFRLVELQEGRITVDGVDISTLGLHELRSKVTIIPQDPMLLKGTVRTNLDPFGEHADSALWDALRTSNLAAVPPHSRAMAGNELGDVARSHITLDSPVSEEGRNLSLGQRQLLALARALVRSSRIVVVDEGTSSVDVETDAKVQSIISSGLGGRTILSIAHRLRTVLMYDRICVMEKGTIVELGAPRVLWDQRGIFWGMCEQSGIKDIDFSSH